MAYSVDKGLSLLVPSFARKRYVDSSNKEINNNNNKKEFKNKKLNKKKK